MRMRISGFGLVVWLAGVQFAAADVKVLGIEPTVLFLRQRPIVQVAWVELLNNGAEKVECKIGVTIGDTAEPEIAVDLPPGLSKQRILAPDIAAPLELRLVVKRASDGKELATQSVSWQPQRKWKVFIVKSSHEDLGYEDFIYKKQHENAEWVDIARRLSNPKLPMGGGQYHHTLETLLLMRNYIEERSVGEWRDLVEKQIKTGQMGLMGAPSGVHSHWMDYEEIARMTYPGRREVKDRFGLDLKTFMIVDNPSLSWSGAQAVADAGFRYVARWGQGWRSGGNNDYQHTKVPAIFWWEAPDQMHRVLFAWRSHYGLSFWYGQTGGGYGNLMDKAGDEVSRELKQIESGSALGPYPYDAVIYPCYVDHAIPHTDERVLPAWNAKYAYPEIRIDSPTPFFEYIENKYGADLPTISGDLNNFSADYATIDPNAHGWKRTASRSLPLAEGLAAISSYLNASFQPVQARAAAIWTQMFDYDEHSWPTQPRPSDMHVFNANCVKRQGAERALNATNQLLDEGWDALAKNIPVSGGPRSLIVFNPLAHERTDVAIVDGAFEKLVDTATGATMACEPVDGGKTAFIAKDVPAYGYKVFRESTGGPAAAGSLTANSDRIANQFYEIRFDRASGNVIQIRDKPTGKELVDGEAKYQFNQMVYVHKKDKESKDGFVYVAKKARAMKGNAGPVRATFDTWIDDEKTGAAIRQTLILYDGLKRIDIVNDLKHVRALYSDRFEDRYCDNIFYAFPLAVPSGQPRAEYPGGVVRPYDDQLRWGSHDYLAANRWVDVSNKDFGVTIAAWNEPIFHFGEIRYNQFSITYKPANSHVFSFAWSNRMAGLLTLSPEEYNATLGYSIAGHSGDWNSGAATQFGWSVASPLVARVAAPNAAGKLDARAMSLLSVDAPNVQLTTLKMSEQPGRGWIVRLVETEGKAADVALDSKLLAVEEAYECDLVENDRTKLEVAHGRARVKIRPFGFATVRLAAGVEPLAVQGLTAKAAQGGGVSLAWSAGAKEGVAYSIYRSDLAGTPPTAFSLVARAAGTTYQDSGVNPGTTYYYRVAAVTKNNVQGPVTEEVVVTTGAGHARAPLITGLSTTRLGKTRAIVSWEKNTRPDVARYFVYRGERPDFNVASAAPVSVQKPSGYFLETFFDSDLAPNHTYYYKIVAEDWAGDQQTKPAVTQVRMPAQ